MHEKICLFIKYVHTKPLTGSKLLLCNLKIMHEKRANTEKEHYNKQQLNKGFFLAFPLMKNKTLSVGGIGLPSYLKAAYCTDRQQNKKM